MSRKALYLVSAANGLTKIGVAISPLRRLVTLRSDSPEQLELIHMSAVEDAKSVEMSLHTEFTDKRSHGEWFRLNEEDIASIRARYPASDISYLAGRTAVLLGLTPEVHALLREAATEMCMPMTKFIVHHGLLAAERILANEVRNGLYMD